MDYTHNPLPPDPEAFLDAQDELENLNDCRIVFQNLSPNLIKANIDPENLHPFLLYKPTEVAKHSL